MEKKNYLKNAQWIFVNGIPGDVCNTYFEYETEFSVEEAENASLSVSASTLYAVSVNGVFVDCGQYADYEDYQVYDTLDISGFVKPGKNILKIDHYVIGTNYFTHRIQIPGIIFAVWEKDNCVLSSNEEVLSRKNTHFADGPMEHISGQLGYVCKYDACAEELPWEKSVLASKEKHLYPRPIKKLVIEEETTGELKTQGVYLTDGKEATLGKKVYNAFLSTRTAAEILEIRENATHWQIPEGEMAEGAYFLLDMGQESVGFLNLDFEVPEDCEVLIGYGEHLEDLRVRSSIKSRNFAVRYYAKAGRNRFFNPFLRLGLRYLQIHIASKTGAIYEAGVRNTYYPLNVAENTIEDALHHKIYDVAVRTLRMCMHEHYEDCPWREQSLYTFDSRVQMLCGYYAFGEYTFPRESLRLFAKSLRDDGTLELCAPGIIPITIPSFTTIYIRQLMEYMEYSKDVAFIREVFDCAKLIVTKLEERIDETGLIPCFAGDQYWNFYEWKDYLAGEEYFSENPPYECPLNAFASDSFYCFARLCDAVQPELAAHYDELHTKLNQQLHKAFFDADRNVYLTRLGDYDRPLHAFTQALALYVGATPEVVKPQVAENMLSKEMVPYTLSASIYAYDALLQTGDTYREHVRKEVEEVWGKMLYAGATTFWETDLGEKDFHNAGSLCHGWSAVPVYLYGKYDLLQ